MEQLEKLIKKLKNRFLIFKIMIVIVFSLIIYHTLHVEFLLKKERIEKNEKIDSLFKIVDSINVKINKVVTAITPYRDFLNAISYLESTNNYFVFNKYGYIGKYQFGITALVSTGVCSNIDDAKAFRDKFINMPENMRVLHWSEIEQESAMIKLIEINKKKLKSYIKKYKGKIVNGIFITESGILAAAHLGGCNNVKKYFDEKYNFKDKNDTSIETYLKKFSKFKI